MRQAILPIVGVLSSLLPGLREVRAPLAAGYVWLVAGWLAFEPAVRRHFSTGVWPSVARLGHLGGAVSLGIAVSFLAYLLGSVSLQVINRGVELFVRQFDPGARLKVDLGGFRFGPALLHLDDRSEIALTKLLRDRVEVLLSAMAQRASGPWDEATVGEIPADTRRLFRELDVDVADKDDLEEKLISGLRQRVESDADLTRTGMLGRESELFSAIDREMAESELRFALIPPLLALAGVLSWRAGAWWAIVIAVSLAVVLLVGGRARLLDAKRRLIESLRLGRATSPALDVLTRAVAAIDPQAVRGWSAEAQTRDARAAAAGVAEAGQTAPSAASHER